MTTKGGLNLPSLHGFQPIATFLVEEWEKNPAQVVLYVVLALVAVYVGKFGFALPFNKKKKEKKLPEGLVKERVAAFKPEPLCPPMNKIALLAVTDPVVLESNASKYAKIRGRKEKVLNLATMDFLGFGQREEQHEAALQALNKYGCGSCGPRGFYGTIDVHLFLEEALAKYFGVEECIVYSDTGSTVSSILPAFSNKSDLLVVDEGCNDSVMTGVNLSRSRVIYFKHNDLNDLERVLKQVQAEDKETGRGPQRRFIVIEGLYRNYGDIAPLPEIVALKKKYKWRLFADESLSLGALGDTGRGLTEYFGIPLDSIELLAGSLSTTFASIGGFCIGSGTVVSHQRLSGAGYCFSAASPPFVSTAAMATLELLEKEGKGKLHVLRKRSQFLQKKLAELGEGLLSTESSSLSPICHVRLAPKYRSVNSRKDAFDVDARFKEEQILSSIVRLTQAEGVLIVCARYSLEDNANAHGPPVPPPSMKVIVTSSHEESEIENAVKIIVKATKFVLK